LKAEIENQKNEGSLVRNIRTNAIGIIVDNKHMSDGLYYKVLTSGKFDVWFISNLEEVNNEKRGTKSFNGVSMARKTI
tara:strand:+ start:774 stop:1007 length:234 start_codon:yes stop_codon:yes gene_type:complete